MNEEIEYAEMLEIPVSTVSVTEKRRKFRKNKGDLKEKLISKVNDRAAGATAPQEGAEAYKEAYKNADAAYPAYSSDFPARRKALPRKRRQALRLRRQAPPSRIIPRFLR